MKKATEEKAEPTEEESVEPTETQDSPDPEKTDAEIPEAETQEVETELTEEPAEPAEQEQDKEDKKEPAAPIEEDKPVETTDLEKPAENWLGSATETTWLDEIQQSEPLETEEVAEVAEAEKSVESGVSPAAGGVAGADDAAIAASVAPSPDASSDTIIADLQSQIQVLKNENTDLRMSKFELLDKIETLESTVKRLNHQLSKRVDAPNYQSDYNSELSLSPEPHIQTTPFQFQKSGDIRDTLAGWKSWQVDMKHWKSVASGPIVEF